MTLLGRTFYGLEKRKYLDVSHCNSGQMLHAEKKTSFRNLTELSMQHNTIARNHSSRVKTKRSNFFCEFTHSVL